MMISNHRDGRLISRLLHYFGIHTVFGSTNRHGFEVGRLALKKMQEENAIIGMTPDGPRGPAHKVSMGCVALSHLAKATIIPIAYATKRKKHLPSWDRFLLPLPFGKGIFIAGNPINSTNFKNKIEIFNQIEEELNRITKLSYNFQPTNQKRTSL